MIEAAGIDFYSQPIQPLLDSRSSANHIQPVLMQMRAWGNEISLVKKKYIRVFFIVPVDHESAPTRLT